MKKRDLKLGDPVWYIIQKGFYKVCPCCGNSKWKQTGWKLSKSRIKELRKREGRIEIGYGEPQPHFRLEDAVRELRRMNRNIRKNNHEKP